MKVYKHAPSAYTSVGRPLHDDKDQGHGLIACTMLHDQSESFGGIQPLELSPRVESNMLWVYAQRDSGIMYINLSCSP